MGVRGLSTFLHENPRFFKPYKLHTSYVIMDGDNLMHSIYFSDHIDVICGGDYNKYAESVRKYILVFLECNVKPVIVFDGGYDKSGKKLKTIYERTNDRLSSIKSIAQSKSFHAYVLPILARDVFISVLIEHNVPFVVSDYEADEQITALANYYKCPVISADSDFYIYDLHVGFIPRDSIETTVILDIDSSGKEYKFLNCVLYHIDEFVSCFPGLEKSVLPLFGTLLGNDYVEGYEFDNFFSNVQLPKYKGEHIRVHARQKKMIGLLSWLKNNTLNEAINQIMQYLKKERRNYIKSIIESAIKNYELHNCNLLHIVDQKLYSKHEFCLENTLIMPCGESFPLDFVLKYHCGQYSAYFINVIVLRKVFLQPQIENISCCSSYECSHHIRKITYGILIRHDIDDKECQNEKCLASIEEYDRQRTSLQKKIVEPIFSLNGIGMLPKINELSHLSMENCKLILMKALGVNSDFISDLPDTWQLLIACINYWLWNCNPYSTEAFIYALIITIIYLSIIKNNNSHKYICKCDIKNPAGVTHTCSTSVICILTRITQSECQNAAQNLKKYLSKPTINNAHPLLLYIPNSYSQLQSCIVCAVALNKLLNNSLKNPEPHKCLNGTMLYNLTKSIAMRVNPKLFVAEILGRETALFSLFKELDFKICYGVPEELILKNQLPFQKTRKMSTNHLDTSKKNIIYNPNKFHTLLSMEQL